VNLIHHHVEDLAAVCLPPDRSQPAKAYNVRDGQLHTWNEVCATGQQRWGVAAAVVKENHLVGKMDQQRQDSF
jgi:hypothetical protein